MPLLISKNLHSTKLLGEIYSNLNDFLLHVPKKKKKKTEKMIQDSILRFSS